MECNFKAPSLQEVHEETGLFPGFFREEESDNYQPVYRECELELMEGNPDNGILKSAQLFIASLTESALL